MSFILLGILNSQVTGAGGGAYELIESNILTSSASSVTFSSIPQDYKHLQIRATLKDTTSNTILLNPFVRFNGDSGANYSRHYLYGNGSSVNSSGSTSSTSFLLADAISTETNIFAAVVMDILDYASTSKNKTVRVLSGGNTTGESRIYLHSGAWYNTNAITSMTFSPNANFDTGTRLSLYGVRG